MWMWLAACTDKKDSPDFPWPDESASVSTEAPVALVSDGAHERFLYIRLDTGELIYSFDLRSRFPDRCTEGVSCIGFGGEPDLDPETGEDRLLTITSPEGRIDYGSMIERVRLTDTGIERDWALTDLDFTVNYTGYRALCSAQTACEAPGGERGCLLDHVHEVAIAEETEAEVVLWVADSGTPGRLIKVRLEKEKTCGVVEDVIDMTDPNAGIWDNPNDIEVVEEGGEQLLLASYFSQDKIPGRTRIVLWEPFEAGWDIRWTFPPESGSYLSGVHNPSLTALGDGQKLLSYAHGNGAGAVENANTYSQGADNRGSLGFALWEDSAEPVYQGDVVLPGEELGFVRDIAWIEGNYWLVTDSGCIDHRQDACDREPFLRVIEVNPGMTSSGKSGAFSTDHSEQSFVEASSPTESYLPEISCGLLTPYEADYRPLSGLGPFLQAKAAEPEGSCLE